MRQLDLFDPLLVPVESTDVEYKAARGGLPGSFWETYSAMANTEGGTVVLGIAEREGKLFVDGLSDAGKLRSLLWAQLNDRQKVSCNLLTEAGIETVAHDGKTLLFIHVPRATRRQRPVYLGANPLGGTFRRAEDGDYRCSEDEVRRMLADQSEEPADSMILEHFTLDDLDGDSLRQFRNRFASRDPDHPWLSEDDLGLLRKLNAWRRDRATGREGLTVAGLLMFGRDEALRDPAAVPNYHVDYRERLSDDPAVRWTDRIVPDGTWPGNLFQFFQRVIQRLAADLKTPFQLDAKALLRKDDTMAHEALREAVANALIHADYRGQGGVVIEKYADRIELSNPGSLLVSLGQLRRGGVSECRNKTLQTMFQLIGGGEKAGSGMDKIRAGWRSQHWRSPRIEETLRPDRVRLVLPMVSLLPPESLDLLGRRFGSRFRALTETQVQALVTAHLEGEVTNARMQEMTDLHPTDITKMLRGLVKGGFLRQESQRRWAHYHLEAVGSPHSGGDSLHSGGDSPHSGGDSLHNGADAALLAIAAPARAKKRLPPAEMRAVIVALCRDRWLTATQIGRCLGRDAENLQTRFLTAMVKEGRLELRHPDVPNRPDQAYRTKP